MKKFSLILLALLGLAAGCVYLLILTVQGEPQAVPAVATYQSPENKVSRPTQDAATFTVLSLNMAHGRKDAAHQVLLTTPQIRRNLDDIIALLNREQADIVALQEADGPSFWSGRFNHVTYIARNTGYSYSTQGSHVEGFGLSYGTALLTRSILSEPLSITFRPSPPTLTKGFTLATVAVSNGLNVDLVSLHLDFFSKQVRHRQIKKLVETLKNRNRPLIIMGDFNNDWSNDSAPQILSNQLNLTTYQPTKNNQVTFPILQKRIDYILLSEEFEFRNYSVLPDNVSDHRAIQAEIKIRKTLSTPHAP